MVIFQQFFGAILGSKKAVAALATVVFIFLEPKLSALGLEVTDEEKQHVIYIVIAYLAAQGVTDVGKSAALVHASTKTKTSVALSVSPDGTAVDVAGESSSAPVDPSESSATKSDPATSGEIEAKG